MTLTPRWKLIFQIAVTLLVVVFVTIAFWKPLQQLAQHDLQIHYGPLVAAGAVYTFGLCCSVTFWWLSLLSLGQRPVPIRVPWAMPTVTRCCWRWPTG